MTVLPIPSQIIYTIWHVPIFSAIWDLSFIYYSFVYIFFPRRKFNHICEQTRFKSWTALGSSPPPTGAPQTQDILSLCHSIGRGCFYCSHSSHGHMSWGRTSLLHLSYSRSPGEGHLCYTCHTVDLLVAGYIHVYRMHWLIAEITINICWRLVRVCLCFVCVCGGGGFRGEVE